MTLRWMTVGLLTFAVGAYAGQQDVEHPWPDHEPPPDYVCVPGDPKTNIHACSCLGMGPLDPMCGTTEENQEHVNSNACKSWCKPDQCKCKVQCDKSTN